MDLSFFYLNYLTMNKIRDHGFQMAQSKSNHRVPMIHLCVKTYQQKKAKSWHIPMFPN